ncbi:MAG: calcium-binding protein [Akkermansiaceae bacterium]|jgi:hypothetical protein
MMRTLFLAAFSLSLISAPVSAEIKAGPGLDYAKLAFYPKRWKEKKIDTIMFPWEGKEIAFLTITDGFDPKVMTQFVGSLDQGWSTYLKFTGKAPRLNRQVNGKPVIAAIPDGNLSCGAGCGYVGATGIEANYFYSSTYKNLQKNPKTIPHLYFYEMGRNFFTFGRKHSCYTTGFAVFMRYVCIDTLNVVDNDKRTRETINKAIEIYSKGELNFLKTFTNAHGLSEKQNRLQTSPTDQPVMYASAMLHLWKLLGDEWLSSYYKNIHTLPSFADNTREGARSQSLGWYLAASVAAQKDLAEIFVKEWRFPLSNEEKQTLSYINWKEEGLDAGKLMEKLFKK